MSTRWSSPRWTSKSLNNPYLRLLRHNLGYRRLWYAQVVSQLGDWFNSIALYTLVLSLTGSARAVGVLIGAQFLPAALASLWTGPLVDRYSRRRLMIVADLLRAGLALCFLLVDRPERVPLIYLFVVLMVSCQALFEPSRKAILPDLVDRDDLVSANAISGATWSSMLALGAAFGGLVAGLLGVKWAFILDAFTFVLSAYWVQLIEVEENLEAPGRRARWTDAVRVLTASPRLLLTACSKTIWCLGGGITLVLTLYGSEMFPLGRDGAISIGLFYACRGLGAGIGPFLARALVGQKVAALERAIPPAFIVGCLGYTAVSQGAELRWCLAFVVLAHLGGSTNWVFSTSLLHLSVPAEFRGRVFALEYFGMTLATATSAYLVGQASDQGWTAPELALAMACMFDLGALVTGLGFWALPELQPD